MRGSNKRKREDEEMPEAPPEPEDGIEAGVTTVHPLQAFVPLAIKLDPTTMHPYSTDYCLPKHGRRHAPCASVARAFRCTLCSFWTCRHR